MGHFLNLLDFVKVLVKTYATIPVFFYRNIILAVRTFSSIRLKDPKILIFD